MKKRFLFDIDGTLTPSRQQIHPEFKEFMLDFIRDNVVCFVTGSDKPKTVEQIGKDLFNRAEYSFNCGGNEVWKQDVLIHRNEWQPPQSVLAYLEEKLRETEFPILTGAHIEQRSGMLNFSIVGRNCSENERDLYIAWDIMNGERKALQQELTKVFSDLEIVIGGEIGLDIFPKGKDKRQAVEFLTQTEPRFSVFFGDQIMEGGNDHEIAIRCNSSYNVKSWKDTYEILLWLSEVKR